MAQWGGRKVSQLAALTAATYGPVCWLCHQPIDLDLPRTAPGGLSVDHVVPRSRGGGNDIDNLRPAHRQCNVQRGVGAPHKPRTPWVVTTWPGLDQ